MLKRSMCAVMFAAATVMVACEGTGSVFVGIAGQVDTLEIVNLVDSIAIRRGETPAVTQTLTLSTGDTATLTASGFNAIGQAINLDAIMWRSTNPSVATANDGVVVAINPGTTDVIASVANVSAVVPTVVEDTATVPGPPPPPPARGSLTITPASAVLTTIGATRQLTVAALDSLGVPISSPSVTWSSSNQSVATVTQSGLVTLTGFGSARIGVTAGCCDGDEATVVGEAPAPPGSAEVIFAADWGTALGKSTAALTDGNRLIELGFPANNLLTTVDLTSLGVTGWPQNGLEISFGNQQASLVGTNGGGGWPAPDIGETIYFRMLIYNDLPANSGVAFEHGMQSNIGQIAHGWQFFSPDGSGNAQLGFFSLTGGFSNYFASVPAGRPLRLEWAMTRLTGASARVELRVYDETVSTTQHGWSNRDFLGNWGQGPLNLESLTDQLPLGTSTDGFRTYTFGAAGTTASVATGLYVTGFAVCLQDWCGPYQFGEGN